MNFAIAAIRRIQGDISLVEKRGCQVLLALLLIIPSGLLSAASLPIAGNEAPVGAFAGVADFAGLMIS